MPVPSINPSTTTPETRATQALSAALLLSFTGGFLDAFLYVAHGRVFAGALTGNLVLAGIALLGRDPHNIVHHLLPIAGFITGICAAFIVAMKLRHHVVLIALGLEAVGLFIASLLPHSTPDLIFIPLVSTLAAFQVGSFRKVDTFVYNSTFITGNMLRAIEAFHTALFRIELHDSVLEVRDLGLVILLFFTGAVTSALLVGRIGNHALWVPTATVLIVLSMAVFGDLRHPGPADSQPAERKVGESN